MGNRTVGVISGGSGSSKFATALDRFGEGRRYGFVCNVGDNFWFHGLYVCPDLDIITYALAGKLDEKVRWGIRGDSRNFLKGLATLGYERWFNLGDEDLALSVARTELIGKGNSLSRVTDRLRRTLKVKHEILPATDDNIQTHILTPMGRIHFQEYWVKKKARVKSVGIDYVGIDRAAPTKQVLAMLSDTVLVLPANPITSITPTILLKGVRDRLRNARVVAVSPFIGRSIFSGPAARLMRDLNIEASSYGVAKLYSDFLKLFLVDNYESQKEVLKIKALGIECVRTNIRIRSAKDKRSIAGELMSML